jgi:hypothetical protein
MVFLARSDDDSLKTGRANFCHDAPAAAGGTEMMVSPRNYNYRRQTDLRSKTIH